MVAIMSLSRQQYQTVTPRARARAVARSIKSRILARGFWKVMAGVSPEMAKIQALLVMASSSGSGRIRLDMYQGKEVRPPYNQTVKTLVVEVQNSEGRG